MLETITRRRNERRIEVQGTGTALPMVGSYLLRLSRCVSHFSPTLRFVSRGTVRVEIKRRYSLVDPLAPHQPQSDGRFTYPPRQISISLSGSGSCHSRPAGREISEIFTGKKPENIPHPPSPQIVMEILSGLSSIVSIVPK